MLYETENRSSMLAPSQRVTLLCVVEEKHSSRSDESFRIPREPTVNGVWIMDKRATHQTLDHVDYDNCMRSVIKIIFVS